MSNHPIEGMMDTTLEKIKQMVDVNTMIGDPITTPDGTVIIPVSKVTYGFASGGSDVAPKSDKQMFGGGTGAGVSVTPVAFLVISGGNVRTVQLIEKVTAVDNAIAALPDLVEKITSMMKKEKGEDTTPEA